MVLLFNHSDVDFESESVCVRIRMIFVSFVSIFTVPLRLHHSIATTQREAKAILCRPIASIRSTWRQPRSTE